ncbi:hypothetical protein [Flavobacterium geliluteum]|uniref:Uncharacterized protein n=1 Tax=Flavobacterium geliluteum TaxID=2816120 RepID=A0A940X6Z4_9FLAO|nr:hypothetical protein [Flavobacterium geliluteum]MBP4139413.1 hypothetical protein [Flavobacterium geliluteum]
MKNIVILLLCFCSCGKGNYQTFDYNKSKNPWITAYKDNVFFACLKESYKNDSIFILIEEKDALNPYDGLSLDDLNETKKLGSNIIKNIPEPIMCENCKEGVNYYMSNCLHYYNSKELDSIAKKAYGEYKKVGL